MCDALTLLAAEGVTSLVLEGGPTLHHAAWTAGVVDRVQVFMTPVVVGAAGVPWLDRPAIVLEELHDRRTMTLEDDVMMEGYVHGAD
jgi:riboflavin biosynthesis pyrimidine reductase